MKNGKNVAPKARFDFKFLLKILPSNQIIFKVETFFISKTNILQNKIRNNY